MTFSKHFMEVVPRIKGNTERGKRILPMTGEASRILQITKNKSKRGVCFYAF